MQAQQTAGIDASMVMQTALIDTLRQAMRGQQRPAPRIVDIDD
jgi:hypothetical protein